jgi:hypothetical protein
MVGVDEVVVRERDDDLSFTGGTDALPGVDGKRIAGIPEGLDQG